jgi:long-chain acyl-CoA synthetase
MIIAGGFNVYPREVEEVLYLHPRVHEAVVIGIPDPYRGQTVKAYVVLREGSEPKAAEHEIRLDLERFCREHLAPYKIPRQIEFRAELPKTNIGKILRRALRDEEGRATSGAIA